LTAFFLSKEFKLSVVRISTTVRNAPAVNVQSCVYGIECEVKEKTDPQNVVFELVGSEDKIRLIAMKTNSKVVSNLAKVRIAD
jgi:hypothetical protein